jgi:hypothetical protein
MTNTNRPGFTAVRNSILAGLSLLILAACSGGGGGGIITTPTASVTAVTVAPGSAALLVGSTTTLVASVTTTGSAASTVTWSSSNSAVASVVASGNTVTVTGVGAGTATITATSTADASKSGTAAITVTAPQTVVATPSSRAFTATSGGALPAAQTVAVTASTGVVQGLLATVSATSNGINWLSVSFAPTSTPSTFTLSVTSTALPAGTYTGTVTIGAPGLTTSTVVTVTYTVSTAPVNPGCVLANATTVSLGQIRSGTLASTDCTLTGGKFADVYRLVLGATTVVQIDNVASAAVDPFIVLLDANGNTLADDDDSGIDVDAQLIRTLAAGTYFIQATSFSPGVTGAYSLMISVSGTPGGMCRPTAAVGIVIGVTTNGSLATTDCYGYADGSLGDIYSFTRAATGTSTFTMTSTVIDTYLRLLNGAADLIIEDDDGAGGTNSRISRQIPAGSYFLIATSFSPGETGAYAIASSSSTAAALVRVQPEDLPPKVRAALRRTPAGTTSLREFVKQKR